MREKNARRWFLEVSRVVMTLVLLLIVLGLWSCSRQMDSITIGNPPFESGALIYIAQDQHFFTGNGLKVVIKDYDSGLAAVNGVLKNEVDMAGAAEFAMVGKAFKREKLRVVGILDRFQFVYLIGRKDRGIGTLSDLKGKKIGVPRQTIAEFYLGRFLNLHGMNLKDVARVDVRPSRAVAAIADGNIDAIVYYEPYAHAVKERLGSNGISWPAQSSQPTYGMVVCREDWIARHAKRVSRFLRALVQAEEYVIHHPAEAKAIVQKTLHHDDAYMATIWPQHQFSLSLDQSLILAMKDEARWMISNNLTQEKQIPDFINFIYVDGLKAVKPEAVKIIR